MGGRNRRGRKEGQKWRKAAALGKMSGVDLRTFT